MFGYVADLAFYHVPDPPNITGLRWRLMLGSAGFPALIGESPDGETYLRSSTLVMTQLFFLPESPRWLMSKGRYKEAFDSMNKLRRSELLAARDIYYTFVLLEEEASIVRGRNRFIEIFTIPRNRRAMLGSTIVMFGRRSSQVREREYRADIFRAILRCQRHRACLSFLPLDTVSHSRSIIPLQSSPPPGSLKSRHCLLRGASACSTGCLPSRVSSPLTSMDVGLCFSRPSHSCRFYSSSLVSASGFLAPLPGPASSRSESTSTAWCTLQERGPCRSPTLQRCTRCTSENWGWGSPRLFFG